MKKLGIVLIAVGILFSSFAGTASALPKFKNAFLEKYTDKENALEYYNLAKKTGCNLCHVKGEEKSVRNSYGEELDKLIEGNAGAKLKKAKEDGNKEEVETKILAELEAAWDKAAEIKNKEGEKYGDLIKAGKLPVPLPPVEEEDGA